MSLIFPIDLENLARSYTFDPVKFAKLENYLRKKIRAFEPPYGSYMLQHLEDTSKDLQDFLVYKRYDLKTAEKIGRAFFLHDVGKLAQPNGVWIITEDKRTTPAKDKEIQRKHTTLGPSVTESAIVELGLDLDENDMRHLRMINYLQVNHHRKLIENAEIDDVLRMAIAVDGFDGKKKANLVNGILQESGVHKIFDEMAGNVKHPGQYDSIVVEEYRAFRKEHRLPDASSGVESLAFSGVS